MAGLTLVLMAGMPGSGKSSLALALGRLLNWPVVDKDTLKSTLLRAHIPDDVSGPTAYELMWGIAQDLVQVQQVSAILDSPARFVTAIERATAIAAEAGARLHVVRTQCDAGLRAKRMASRLRKSSQPTDTATATGGAGWRFDHLPAGTIEVETTRPANVLAVEVARQLS